MSDSFNRRGFLSRSLIAASAAGWASFEEQNLLANAGQSAESKPTSRSVLPFPNGKIGKVSISRVICGGNLISGFAHSRDLIYVSDLLKQYFTDSKVFETFERCEAHGLNTAILRVDDNTIRLLKAYRKDRAGTMQWIAQVKITESDQTAEIDKAADHGAVGAFVHGGVGDEFVEKGQVALLGRAVEHIKKKGLIAGLAGHSLSVAKASEKAGLAPDFYMKTFNSKRYWSASVPERNDNVWEDAPDQTAAFMQEVDVPWIAYKVLGAGAIHPREGFQYAFQNGADFLCVGMFDFQIAENVDLAHLALERTRQRNRPWSA